MRTQTNAPAFIESVCTAAGIKTVEVRSGHGRNARVLGHGWVRFIAGDEPRGNVLEQGRMYPSRVAALAAAHKHYNLRSA
jgi:hypothetical protein